MSDDVGYIGGAFYINGTTSILFSGLHATAVSCYGHGAFLIAEDADPSNYITL